MAYGKCAACEQLFDGEQAIVKQGKPFCCHDCLRTYAWDLELARIAAALEGILERMGGRQ